MVKWKFSEKILQKFSVRNIAEGIYADFNESTTILQYLYGPMEPARELKMYK